MSELVKVAVDAMGGDFAPVSPVEGAIAALKESDKLMITLYGQKEVIEAELAKCEDYDKSRLAIEDCREVIETAEPPVVAIKSKKDSSIVRAMLDVKAGKCDAYVSAGSTGANLVGGQVLVGRIKGVERPPLAPLIPSADGPKLLLDCGANVDAKPSWLIQFAKMGSIYMKNIMGIKNPKVGILNIGAEEEKGNALVKETFPLLKECKDINFVGSIEARDVPAGLCDVIVCDAFAGNVLLKTYEGVGGTLLKDIKSVMMSSLKTKIGALLIKKTLKTNLKKYDLDQYGGAPMLGLSGLVCKTHGSASAAEFKNSILQAIDFKENDIVGKIGEAVKNM